jgi:hypothetical protein
MFDKTISVTNTGEGQNFSYLQYGKEILLNRRTQTDIPFVAWLEIKITTPKHIENKMLSVDQEEESRLFELYHSYCFQEFESMGIPKVKASIKLNQFTQEKELFFAQEWLERQELLKQKDKFNLLNSSSGFIFLSVLAGVLILIIGRWL